MNRKQGRELTRTIQSKEISLEVVHPDAAGIDIGNEVHYVSVPPSRDNQSVRHFACTTAELKAMAAWLRQCGIRTVAMQSTGVYWIAVFDILEEAGFEVFLVNARDTKNLPGRKSDVQGRKSRRRKLCTSCRIYQGFDSVAEHLECPDHSCSTGPLRLFRYCRTSLLVANALMQNHPD